MPVDFITIPLWFGQNLPDVAKRNFPFLSIHKRAGRVNKWKKWTKQEEKAGEKEYLTRLARKDGVPINESVQQEINAVRDELQLTQYKFPWEK